MNLRTAGTIGAVFATVLFNVACSPSAKSGENGVNTYALRGQNGRWKLYSGEGIAAAVRRGDDLSKSPRSYFMIDVPEETIERAMRDEQRLFTVSLEEKTVTDVSILVRTADYKAPTTNIKVGGTIPLKDYLLRPGDPWLTGYVQVFFPDKELPSEGIFTDTPVGALMFVKYEKNLWPDGHYSYSSTVFEGPGLKADPNLPVLKYDRLTNTDPATWPALPENWK
jgi:hypothetical protein